MLRFGFSGDLLLDDAVALVNLVNCVGVMGKGIALQFHHAYPVNFLAYKSACASGELQPGGVFVFPESGHLIINAATKRHWRNGSELSWVRSCVLNLRQCILDYRIPSIAVSQLGAGLGGLDWTTQVRPIVAEILSDPALSFCDIRVYGA